VAKVMEGGKVQDINLEEPNLGLGDSGSSSFSSSSSSFNLTTTVNKNGPQTTEDALEYIAGYLAKKFKNAVADLGDFKYKFKSDHAYNLLSWVQQLSYGGLIKPKHEWLEKIKKMEYLF
jgi:hypothetical protein